MISTFAEPNIVDSTLTHLRECAQIGIPVFLGQIIYLAYLVQRRFRDRVRFRFSLAEGFSFFLLASLPVTYSVYILRCDYEGYISCWDANTNWWDFYSVKGTFLALTLTVLGVLIVGMLIGKLRHDQLAGVNGGAANSILMGGWISVLCYMAVFTSYAWFIR